MTYDAQKILSEQARPRVEIWRTLVGLAILATGTLALTTVWLFFVPVTQGRGTGIGGTPEGMLWLLSTFLCPLAVLGIVMHLLHRRRLFSLVGPRDRFRRQFFRVLIVQLAVLGLALIMPSPAGQAPVPNLSVAVWVQWLVPALALLVVQVGIEELVFRGYLQSQLAARVRSPLIWLVAPAVVFAVLHLDPMAGANRWQVVGITFLFALVAGDLTARSGTLGPAFAIHLVNNIGALVIVAAKGPMQGLALYVLPVDLSDPSLGLTFLAEAILILISWLGARLVLRR